ncbi:MAG: porin family protein [Proteobacteria bacterium]|nr:porin family protein [Pseudomonadota bacterium]
MKKLKLALLASAVFMAASAQAHWQGNFLLGVSAGGAWHSGDDNIGIIITTPVNTSAFTVTNDNDNNHFIWGLLAGYQMRNDNWLAGLEVNVDWRGHDDDINFVLQNNVTVTSPAFGTFSRDRDAVVGITARFGYYVLPCLTPYIRLGADYSERDINFNAFMPDVGVTVSSFDDQDDDRWGFVGGLGIEYFTPMIPCLSLRAEWDYHSRKHNDNDFSIIASDSNVLFTVNGDGNRHEQTAIVSLVYNFPI